MIVTALELLALWLVVAIPAAVLLAALTHLMPSGPAAVARRLVGWMPGFGDLYQRFCERVGAAHEAIVRNASVRVVLERRHRALLVRLRQEREYLEVRLRQVESSSAVGSGESLHKLLGDFRRDTVEAKRFGTIDDDLVDQSVELRKARAETRAFSVGALVVGFINFGLLYLFFEDLTGSEQIPLIGVDIAVPLALIFPALEFFLGSLLDMNERNGAGGIKTVGYAFLAFVVLAAGAVEYFIFYSLFRGFLQNMPEFQVGGLAHVALSSFGPALTLAQGMLGYYLSKRRAVARELVAIQDLKRQVADANGFVEGLPGRLSRIEAAAAQASGAIDRLRADMAGQGQAVMSIGETFREHRERLLSAIDEVNPDRWQREPEAGAGDRSDVSRFSWALALALLPVGGCYVAVVRSIFAQAGIFDQAPDWAPLVAAVVSALAGLAGGAFLFDRIGIATGSADRRGDVVFPRDQIYRVVAATAVAAVLVALLSAGWMGGGAKGIVEGLLVCALFVMVVVLGSYLDHVARGLDFLGRASFALVAFTARVLGAALAGATLGIAAGSVWVVFALTVILAWPVLWIWRTFRGRRGSDSPRENATRPSAPRTAGLSA